VALTPPRYVHPRRVDSRQLRGRDPVTQLLALLDSFVGITFGARHDGRYTAKTTDVMTTAPRMNPESKNMAARLPYRLLRPITSPGRPQRQNLKGNVRAIRSRDEPMQEIDGTHTTSKKTRSPDLRGAYVELSRNQQRCASGCPIRWPIAP
jgi:hypothetical protein